ncbi:MAG: type IV-A pilus assembly ATPase PilB [Dissulfurispiraceae bacterium]
MGLVGVSSLGQLLLKAGLITEEQLLEALLVQKKEGKRLGSVLLHLGYITEEDLAIVLGNSYDMPLINLANCRIDTSLSKLIPYETARKYLMLPISWDGDSLRIAVADPSSRFAINNIKFLTGTKVSLYIATESAITEAIEKYYLTKASLDASKRNKKSQEHTVLESEDFNKVIDSALENITTFTEKNEEVIEQIDAPIIKLVNNILWKAVQSKASDIHIEPSEKVVNVRYRIDGVLQPILKVPLKIKNAMLSRIKILSSLDISERRLPQDGRIKLKFGEDRMIDLRVSTFPTHLGEKIVLRILDKSAVQLDLPQLGFEDDQLQDFYDAIEKPYGMILVTGPTGSGKTTTLYAALSRLNRSGVNIMTAEDPIEFTLPGINQGQIREEIGLTFASALRSFLRQDPDIIMIGEIRDHETAEISIKAALTGHLVLSTLHTNDAPSTMTRLVDMKIEPFLVSSSLILIAAQRLMRKVCPYCREEQQLPESVLEKMGFPLDEIKKAKFYMGKGCKNCSNTGFRGRIAIYEVLPMREELKDLIHRGDSAVEIKREAMKLGMLTLRQSAIRKVMEGTTSIDELLRVTLED